MSIKIIFPSKKISKNFYTQQSIEKSFHKTILYPETGLHPICILEKIDGILENYKKNKLKSLFIYTYSVPILSYFRWLVYKKKICHKDISISIYENENTEKKFFINEKGFFVDKNNKRVPLPDSLQPLLFKLQEIR